MFVVERALARFVSLPASGSLTIGRDPDAEIQLQDPVASRRHAQIHISGGAVRVTDCGSRNGLRVNGVREGGAVEIAPGDVIEIGDVALVLSGGKRPVSTRLLSGTQEVVRRMQAEIDRAVRHRSPLAVAVLALGPRALSFSSATGAGAADVDRAIEPRLCALDVAGRLTDGTVLIAFGERARAEATSVVERIVGQLLPAWPAARARVVSCPEEGADALAIIGAFWTAVESRASAPVPSVDEPVPPTVPPSAAGSVTGPVAAPGASSGGEAQGPVFKHLSREIEELERRRIAEALQATGGIKTRAAKLIGVPERTFRLKLRQYGFS